MQLQNSFDEEAEHQFQLKPVDALFVYNYEAFHELLNSTSRLLPRPQCLVIGGGIEILRE